MSQDKIRNNRISQEKLKLQPFENKYDINFSNDGIYVFFKIQLNDQIGQVEGIIDISKNYPFYEPFIKFQLQKNQICKMDICNFRTIEDIFKKKWRATITLIDIIEYSEQFLTKNVILDQGFKNNLYIVAQTGDNPYNKLNLLALLFMITVLIKYLISLGPYCGQNTPPNYGDYEAQRHWMEITFHTPPQEWYVETQFNDLKWWRLDYPPASGYHAYFFGWLSHLYDEKSVELVKSRGFENEDQKVFMRITALVTDLIVNSSAQIAFVFYDFHKYNFAYKTIILVLALISPGLTMIDHGHFQYNSAALGFSTWGLLFCCKQNFILGSIFFVLALNFKQMSLYFALPFFVYILGNLIKNSSQKTQTIQQLINFGSELFNVGFTVIVSFIILWLPWLSSYQLLMSVVSAIFPFHRGLYQLKVASFWCITDVFMKWEQNYSLSQLQIICIVLTLFSSMISLVPLFLNPTKSIFKLSLFTVSLAFYFFAFHVHEKTIIFPLAMCVLNINQFGKYFVDFTIISNFTMYHLLKENKLQMQYFTLNLIYFYFANDFVIFAQINSFIKNPKKTKIGNMVQFIDYNYLKYGRPLILTSMVVLHFCDHFIAPPQKLQYLWHLLFAFVGFCFFWIIFLRQNLIILQKAFKDRNKIKSE